MTRSHEIIIISFSLFRFVLFLHCFPWYNSYDCCNFLFNKLSFPRRSISSAFERQFLSSTLYPSQLHFINVTSSSWHSSCSMHGCWWDTLDLWTSDFKRSSAGSNVCPEPPSTFRFFILYHTARIIKFKCVSKSLLPNIQIILYMLFLQK